MSQDDIISWVEHGWLSAELVAKESLQEPECWEIEFIRDIARSGLSDSQIGMVLAKLPSPFRFNPRTIAYNFGLGWVTPPDPSDVFEVVDDNVESWIDGLLDNEDDIRLIRIRDLVLTALDEQR